MTFNPLQHSHSTSSIQSANNNNNHGAVMNSIQHNNITSSSNINKRDNYYQITSSLARNEVKSPMISSNRANTLPRNNQQLQNDETNIIQILDPSNPLSRKSPTPRMHQGLLTTANNNNNAKAAFLNPRPLNGSQLSLLSDRSQHQYYNHHVAQQKPSHFMNVPRGNALNLGIPHSEAPSSSYDSPNSNMPRDLEDFDDLIKYSEEVEQRQAQQQHHQSHPHNIPHHTNLKGKGSNVSIGHSSGYQSIPTQSQSSSPIENVNNVNVNPTSASIIQQNIEFFNSKIQSSGSSSNVSTSNRPTKLNGKYGYISPKYSVVPPLAFKNPLYQMQNGANGVDTKSTSLTPSSSEERITIDERQNALNNNHVSSSSNVPSLIDSSSLNSRRTAGSNRMPRTNPLVSLFVIF